MVRAAWLLALIAAAGLAQATPKTQPALAEILDHSPPADWREVDPSRTLYMDLPRGRVVIELAPDFAPNHVANILKLVRAGYFDGAAIVRSQDNYVVQWSQPDVKRPLGQAQRTLKAEFTRRYGASAPFTSLPDRDTYAPETGFSHGFPAARDPATHRTWLAHCYGMVGAGRDNDADSGGGTELYAVIGQAPRQLDRNVTLVGRVLIGIDLLSSLPRGHGDLGFYQTPAERIPIKAIRLASDLPPAERLQITALRTDSPTFAAVVQNRRYRQDAWYKVPAGHIDVCNVPLSVRVNGKP
ncbi:MAG TPA: peptidylprolyl isomerase [Caulobacteraceae bacterium]|jgi:peptidylprolyl isomerase